MKSFASDFSPERSSDDYQIQLRKLIEAKLAEGDALDTDETFGEAADGDDKGAEVVDLMEALKQSIAKNSGRPTPKAAHRVKPGSPKRRPTTRTKPA